MIERNVDVERSCTEVMLTSDTEKLRYINVLLLP